MKLKFRTCYTFLKGEETPFACGSKYFFLSTTPFISNNHRPKTRSLFVLGRVTISRVKRSSLNVLGRNTPTSVGKTGLDVPASASSAEKAQRLETATYKKVEEMLSSQVAYRFIPYFSMHEFESLLFSDPAVLAVILDVDEKKIRDILAPYTTPEEINCGLETAPSKRLVALNRHYSKTLDGPETAELIGIETMRTRCPHFHA